MTESLTPTQTTTAEIVPARNRLSALAAMAERFNLEPATLLSTLRNTVFKGATNEQLAALVVVANEHGLNPFTREIYAFPDRSGGIQAVIGVDGWIRVVTRQPSFDGVEFEFTGEGDTLACTCTLYVKGRAHPVRVTETIAECRRNTDAWRAMPRRMLRHKAFIQASRLAFGLSGLHDEDDVVQQPTSTRIIRASSNMFEPVALPAPNNNTVTAQTDAGSANVAAPAQGDPTTEPPDEAAAAPEAEKAPSEPTPQERLEALVTGAGYSIDDLWDWALKSGNVQVRPPQPKWRAFADVPTELCSRLTRAKVGLMRGLRMLKEAAQ